VFLMNGPFTDVVPHWLNDEMLLFLWTPASGGKALAWCLAILHPRQFTFFLRWCTSHKWQAQTFAFQQSSAAQGAAHHPVSISFDLWPFQFRHLIYVRPSIHLSCIVVWRIIQNVHL
jgi:hypothetical protein